jgi:hypothetical protein
MAMHRVYYKGVGGNLPKVRALVSVVSLCLFVARLWTKVGLVVH